MTDQTKGFVIAVVDDDQRILGALEILLESADYFVRTFASARELLENGGLANVDCLISDIDMPVMDGFELLRLVRAERPDLPVIFITGHPDLLDRLSPIARNSFYMFKKPFDGEELLSGLREMLQNLNPRHSRR